MDLAHTTILLTGASQGLGAALAHALAHEGARLALVARHEAPLSALADALRAQGHEVFAIPGDVADKHDIYRITGAAAALLGPIDMVIHNASTLGPLPMPPLLSLDCEDLAHVLETNLIGPFRLSKAVAGGMALRKRGLLVHISSDAATNAYPGWGAYGVSKAALDHLSRSWAAELGEDGVISLSIDPGEMDTQMHRDALPEADPALLARPSEVAARIVALLRRADTLPNGARLDAQRAEEAQ